MRKTILLTLTIFTFSCNYNKDWNIYGGSHQRTQYIDSEKINKKNISKLVKAWEYRTMIMIKILKFKQLH